MKPLVVCEHVVAIRKHLREVTSPIDYNGHYPRPLTLCGTEAAWDTQLPISSCDCFDCQWISVMRREYECRHDFHGEAHDVLRCTRCGEVKPG